MEISPIPRICHPGIYERRAVMAIQLKNSLFIHVPKTGGNTVKHLLRTYVENCVILGDEFKDAHATPDTDKNVFGFIRHPATFLRSLWLQRRKKKATGPEWNWQLYMRLEQECQSSDYETFVSNALKGENYVWDYYQHYLGKYENVEYCKTESLTESLIAVLKQNDEVFDEAGIRQDPQVINASNRVNKKIHGVPNVLADSMSHEQINMLVTKTENHLCNKFGYYT